MKWIERPNGDLSSGSCYIRKHYYFGRDGLGNETIRIHCSLFVDGIEIIAGQEYDIDSCKRIAEVMGGVSLFDKIRGKLLHWLDKREFDHEISQIGLTKLPEMDYPHREWLLKKAKQAVLKEDDNFNVREVLKEGGKEITQEGLDCFLIESWPIFRELKLKRQGDLIKERVKHFEEREKKRLEAPKPPQISIKSDEMTKWANKGESRNLEGLIAIYTVTGESPWCKGPDNAKFSTLQKWAKRVRLQNELKGRFATLSYLIHELNSHFTTTERRDLAVARIKVLYQDEDRNNGEQVKAMIAKKPEVPGKEQEKQVEKILRIGKDKWGFRLGTGASAINSVITAELQTIEQIAKEAKQEPRRTASHLSSLLKRKLVKKVNDKFRIRKQPKIRDN